MSAPHVRGGWSPLSTSEDPPHRLLLGGSRLVGLLRLVDLRLRLGLLRRCPLLRLNRTFLAIASRAARLSRRNRLAPLRFLPSKLAPSGHVGCGQRRVVGGLPRAHGASSSSWASAAHAFARRSANAASPVRINTPGGLSDSTVPSRASSV